MWFSLAVYGSRNYEKAIKQTLKIATQIADGITETKNLELVLGPQLSVVLFRSLKLSKSELYSWSETHRRDGSLLCLPTIWKGETVLRICVVNPNTDAQKVLDVLRTLE